MHISWCTMLFWKRSIIGLNSWLIQIGVHSFECGNDAGHGYLTDAQSVIIFFKVIVATYSEYDIKVICFKGWALGHVTQQNDEGICIGGLRRMQVDIILTFFFPGICFFFSFLFWYCFMLCGVFCNYEQIIPFFKVMWNMSWIIRSTLQRRMWRRKKKIY